MAAGCCGGSVGDVATEEICGFLSDLPAIPTCLAEADQMLVLRGSGCFLIDACKAFPRFYKL